MKIQTADEENFKNEKITRGLPTLIAVKVNTKADIRQVISKILQIPYVENVYKVTGEIDVMVVVRTGSSFSLNNVIESIRALPGVMETNSYLVLQEFKKEIETQSKKF